MRARVAFAVLWSLTAVGVSAQPRSGGMGEPGMGMGSPQGQQGMMGPYGYRGLDRNVDGVITKEELSEQQRLLDRLESNWEQADRDGDGRVDHVEFAAFDQSVPPQ